jgi:hypothetical protein
MFKKIHLKNGLSRALILTLSLLCSLSLGQYAHATSPADDDVHILDRISVGGAGDPCDEQLRTANWMDPTWWRSTWNYQNNYNGAHDDTEDFIDELTTNMETGSGWAVMQRPNANNGSMNMITIQTFSPSATLTLVDGGRLLSSSTVRSFDIMLNPGSSCRLQNYNSGAQNVSSYGNSIAGEYGYLFVASDHIAYPSGYEGPEIPATNAHADLDGDGLNAAQEATQGTSNSNKDTDGDGLSDFIESTYNPDRNDTFCGSTCTYPTPDEKDLYVEVDWMKDPSTNESYKPTTTQLTSVINAYSAHGIHAHFDTGQYGGGNELPIYVSELKFAPDSEDTDFFNIKNGDGVFDPNFSSVRRGVWHYMITGYKAYVDGGNASTGASYAGDDDALIAIGRVKELAPTNQDMAISGTIIHELGHNLCLSKNTYTGQDSSCVFSGIDTYAGNDYTSSMNYSKQMGLIDYSEGTNGSSDHDDWSAVLLGMKDFVTYGEDPTESFARGSVPFSKQVEN